jgi:hypothetical protein
MGKRKKDYEGFDSPFFDFSKPGNRTQGNRAARKKKKKKKKNPPNKRQLTTGNGARATGRNVEHSCMLCSVNRLL